LSPGLARRCTDPDSNLDLTRLLTPSESTHSAPYHPRSSRTSSITVWLTRTKLRKSDTHGSVSSTSNSFPSLENTSTLGSRSSFPIRVLERRLYKISRIRRKSFGVTRSWRLLYSVILNAGNWSGYWMRRLKRSHLLNRSVTIFAVSSRIFRNSGNSGYSIWGKGFGQLQLRIPLVLQRQGRQTSSRGSRRISPRSRRIPSKFSSFPNSTSLSPIPMSSSPRSPLSRSTKERFSHLSLSIPQNRHYVAFNESTLPTFRNPKMFVSSFPPLSTLYANFTSSSISGTVLSTSVAFAISKLSSSPENGSVRDQWSEPLQTS